MYVKDLFEFEDYSDFYYEIKVDGLSVVLDSRETVFSILCSACLTSKIDSYTVNFVDSTVTILMTTL